MERYSLLFVSVVLLLIAGLVQSVASSEVIRIRGGANEEYKDKENAVRSVNNLLRRLMNDGIVERKKTGKSYKYRVSGKLQTVMVDA